MKLFTGIFFALLAFSPVFSATGCSGNVSHYLPAVVGDYGIIVNMSLELANGTGDTYISIYPSIGMATQESMKNALDYSFYSLGRDREECDARIKAQMDPQSAGYIDGPSGGAAIAVMGIAVLGGKDLRKDAIITGEIRQDGSLGEVGGLYEKAKIAKQMGLKYFLTPHENIYERIMLRMLQEDGEMRVIEVSNISDASDFLIYGKELQTSHEPIRAEEVNQSMKEYGEPVREFENVSRETMAFYRGEALLVSPKLVEDEQLGGYFEQINANQETLMQKGYYFSAANNAFLNYLDVGTIANVETLDLGRRIEETESCLSSMPGPQMTDLNFEWIGGAEVRAGWAREKLDGINKKNWTLREERYYAYHEAMYADGWCRIGTIFLDNAPKGGTPVDEKSLKNLSANYLKQALEIQTDDTDMKRHVRTAQSLDSQGKYAGAIIESVYVIRMSNGSAEIAGMEPDKITWELLAMEKENHSSLWGRVYASHAAFLKENQVENEAFRLYGLSSGLDEASQGMGEALGAGKGALMDESAMPYAYALGGFLIATALFVLAFIAHALAKRMKLTGNGPIRGATQESAPNQKTKSWGIGAGGPAKNAAVPGNPAPKRVQMEESSGAKWTKQKTKFFKRVKTK